MGNTCNAAAPSHDVPLASPRQYQKSAVSRTLPIQFPVLNTVALTPPWPSTRLHHPCCRCCLTLVPGTKRGGRGLEGIPIGILLVYPTLR